MRLSSVGRFCHLGWDGASAELAGYSFVLPVPGSTSFARGAVLTRSSLPSSIEKMQMLKDAELS